MNDVDFVIETAVEEFDLKEKIFKQLEEIVPEDTVISTNTSGLSVCKLAATIPKTANRVCGMHFFYPVPMMKLCEVVYALQTDEKTIATTVELAKRMNKTPITVRDTPAFINNRVFLQYLLGGI